LIGHEPLLKRKGGRLETGVGQAGACWPRRSGKSGVEHLRALPLRRETELCRRADQGEDSAWVKRWASGTPPPAAAYSLPQLCTPKL